MANTSHPAALYQFRKVTRITALIILLLVGVGFFMPTDYRVERSVVIDAPRDLVVSHVLKGDQLASWMYIQSGQVDGFDGVLVEGDSVDLSYADSEDKGVLTVTDISSYRIGFDVRPKPAVNQVSNSLEFLPDSNGTLVKWTIEGRLSAGLLSPYLAIFANDIAGNNFEKSLASLKEQVEQLL
ncbi:SRPBCC family protein [Marinomonas sp. A79]|uniref:SRPBCC family protein n=1 Tax=Marinomonas vulgaris TaxID=2823372 RepID=A0ABS5HAJ9_9GAMM|nr:SRPBCC family protein [Marinomonas vulgaris]MBR7887979.1 SRPBCC family protein [Marinomonas vulgaris]